MNCEELISKGAIVLKKNKIKSYQIDSELILSKVLNKPKDGLILNTKYVLNNSHVKYFNELIERRARKKEPMAYILKKKDFWNSSVFVNKNVLIPRPETELLVEQIIKFNKKKNPLILDIGTGSGCIIISLLDEIKKAKGIAIDVSTKALKIAKINSLSNNTFHRIKFSKKSVNSFIKNKFDIIVSNPTYIKRHQLKNLAEDIKLFEPKIALDGGNDGLDVIRKVIYKSRKILKINGLLGLEIGYGQYKKASQILKFYKFREKFLIKDYRNNIRCIIATNSNPY